jgi:hypothetical protein
LNTGDQGRTLHPIAASYIELFWNSGRLVKRPGLRGGTMSEQPRALRATDNSGKAALILPVLIALWFLNSFASQYLTLDRDTIGIYWPRREWLYATS